MGVLGHVLAAAGLAGGLTAGAAARADGLDGAADPGEQPVIRVLLHRGSEPVRVEGARLEVAGLGLLRNGAPLGPRWTVEGPVRVNGVRYRGRVVAWRNADEGLTVVNEVPVERYVEGILLREVYPGWGAEMLRAQAVVARTYALNRAARRRGRAWDVTAGQAHQVYGGMDAEAPEAARAVAATRGQVLVHAGRPILAAYHSASGGRTASAEEVWGRPLPYLVSVPVDGEEVSPHTYWRIRVPAATLGRALGELGHAVGAVEEVAILERSKSGRVRRATVRGRRGSGEVTGRELRRAAGGLPSTLFDVRLEDGEVLFVGSGHGHGVGMSQWGAEAMARRGAGYRDILGWFYPGAVLVGGWGTGETL